MRLRLDELHPLVQPEFVDQRMGAQGLDVALHAARAADDDQSSPGIAECCESPNRHVGTLERLDAPDEQQQRSVEVEPQGVTCARLVARSEECVLDAWSDDLETTLRVAVVETELIGLFFAAHTDRVGAVHDLGLGAVTPHRLGIAVRCLHPSKRVERGHERHVEFVLEPMPDHTTEPVVAVDHVGAFVAGEPIEHAATELVGHLRQRLFREMMRTCGDVDHTMSRFDDDLVGEAISIGTCERGGLDACLSERRTQFAHVHVHPAAVAGARLQQRRRVEGDHRGALHNGADDNNAQPQERW